MGGIGHESETLTNGKTLSATLQDQPEVKTLSESKSGFSPTRRHNNPQCIIYLTIEHQKHVKKLLELSRENRLILYGTESLRHCCSRKWPGPGISHGPHLQSQHREGRGRRIVSYRPPGVHSEFQANVKSCLRNSRAGDVAQTQSTCLACPRTLNLTHCACTRACSTAQHRGVQQKVSADVCSLASHPQSA